MGAWRAVIPAKAGTSGHGVSAGLPEVPAFAGMTFKEKTWFPIPA
jgi:hypothetical protein